MVPTGPAIANAVYHAAGVRIDTMPLTSEKVWAALQK
jgi:CO/xanthine dehydrogenase Mo-binding subunit